jgi:hypothetical protein
MHQGDNSSPQSKQPIQHSMAPLRARYHNFAPATTLLPGVVRIVRSLRLAIGGAVRVEAQGREVESCGTAGELASCIRLTAIQLKCESDGCVYPVGGPERGLFLRR